MLRLARLSLMPLVAAASLLACGGDSTGPNDGDLVGVYTLISINGQALPVIIDQVGNDIAEITEGTVTLDDDQSFDDVTEFRITQSGVVTTEVDATSGTWSVNASNVVQFSPSDNSGTYTMTWDGEDRLTQIFQGFTLVYERNP